MGEDRGARVLRRGRTRKIALGSAVACVGVGALCAVVSFAHPEHPTLFPTAAQARAGRLPAYRTTGPYLVVCQKDSGPRINRIFGSAAHTRYVRLAATARRRARAAARRHARNAGRLAALARRYERLAASSGRDLNRQLALLKRCRFDSIQAAVNHARSGFRIEILPGVYTEPASRVVPIGSYHQPPCANDYVVTEGFNRSLPPPAGPPSNDPPVRPDRNYMVDCPNSKYLIVVSGDPRHEPFPPHPTNAPDCFQLCDLQIEGTGRQPGDVVIEGDRRKVDVLRVDRANGIYLRNFTVEQAWFNDVDVVELNGFVIQDIVARYAQDYGILSFTAVNGLYDHDTAYGNGDSGLYPGSTMKGCDIADANVYATCASTGKPNADGLPGRTGCQRYSIEIRNSESYGNTGGYSGTAGNSTWVHDNKFHDNVVGLSTDSAVAGHPGFPQECVKWEHNEIYSNNLNLYDQSHLGYCAKTPFENRPRTMVCPQFGFPIGTGVFIAGGNRDLLRNNYIYDNWRAGVYLFYVPASIRADTDPTHQQDTSNGNQFIDNQMGHAPDGRIIPNGTDFAWDGQGIGNCWSGNASSGTGRTTNNPLGLPGCFGGSSSPAPTNPPMVADEVAGATWDPVQQPNPPGTDWYMEPPRP